MVLPALQGSQGNPAKDRRVGSLYSTFMPDNRYSGTRKLKTPACRMTRDIEDKKRKTLIRHNPIITSEYTNV